MADVILNNVTVNSRKADHSFACYDQVGILLVPAFIQPTKYTYENLLVVFATAWGVVSQTLLSVCENSEECYIRHLLLGQEHLYNSKEAVQERKEKERIAKENKKKGGKPVVEKVLHDDSEEDDSDFSKDAKYTAVQRRAAVVSRYYQVASTIVNRPYRDSMHQMVPMFSLIRERTSQYYEQNKANAVLLTRLYTRVRNMRGQCPPEDLFFRCCRESRSGGVIPTQIKFNGEKNNSKNKSKSSGNGRVTTPPIKQVDASPVKTMAALSSKGAPPVDGMTLDELCAFLQVCAGYPSLNHTLSSHQVCCDAVML